MKKSKALCAVLEAYQLKYPNSVTEHGTKENEVFETIIEMIGHEKIKENINKSKEK